MNAVTRQVWNPQRYAADAAFVPALGAPVLQLLDPKRGERVLDLGCGDGVLTELLIAAGAAVTAIDASPEMVCAAQERGIDAHVLDARELADVAAYDAVFTNAVLHWIPEPERVAANVFRALRPGGRYVGEFGGFGNIAAIRAGIRGVLNGRGHVQGQERQYYPTARAYSELLAAAGFMDVTAEIIHRPTGLPGGLEGWLETFRGTSLLDSGVSHAEMSNVIGEIVDLLKPILQDRDGRWWADYVRLRFIAFKPQTEGQA